MARIRTIKPDFWASDQVTDCSPMARLLFIGIWNFADDGGVIPFKPKTLKARVFPADSVDLDDIRRMVGELLRVGLLGIFEAEGEVYLFVTGWKHQKIDRPSYKYPKPPKRYEPPNPDQLSLSLRRTFDEGHPPEGKGKEGKGIGGTFDEPSPKESSPPPDPPAVKVIDTFDEERDRIFGENLRRPWKHPNDLGDAKRFLTTGADLDLCRTVFRSTMERMKAKGRQPPGNLRYFENAVVDAVAAAKDPMPAPRPPNGAARESESAPTTRADIRQQMKNRAAMIAKGIYLSNVMAADVRGMIEAGWLTTQQAEKAGYHVS